MAPVLLLGTLGLVAVCLQLFVFFCVRKQLDKHAKELPKEGPRVAVLRPMRGADPGLEENLVALYAQDYENFEVILGAEDPDDPALAVARLVASRYPHRSTRIVVGGAGQGLNPKVRLLRRLVEFTSAELVLVSDSNVRPDKSYLGSLVSTLISRRASLVHSLLMGNSGDGLGGRLEDLLLSGWVAGSVCFTEEGGHPCVIGKSMLMRRSVLDELGGFAEVADHLAEDYILGRKFRQAGHEVCLSARPLLVMNSGHGLSTFWNRHVRWGQMRRRISPVSYGGELLANPTPFLLGAIHLSEGVLAACFGGALVLKWSAEFLSIRRLSGRGDATNALLLPLKDLLLVPIWATALFRRTVNWRGQLMKVERESLLVPLSSEIHHRPAVGLREQLQS